MPGQWRYSSLEVLRRFFSLSVGSRLKQSWTELYFSAGLPATPLE